METAQQSKKGSNANMLKETIILLIYVTCVHSLETGKWHEEDECLLAKKKTDHFIIPLHLFLCKVIAG